MATAPGKARQAWRRGVMLAAATAASALGLGACGDDPVTGATEQARRREVALQPVDVRAKQEAIREERRLYDADGALLPGDQIFAGIRMPRGLERKLDVDNRHYFHTPVPLAKLRSYFGPRLKTAEVVPEGERTFTYVKAQTMDGPKPHIVTVRIGPAPGLPRLNEIRIIDLSTGRISQIQPFERSQAQLKAIREHAE